MVATVTGTAQALAFAAGADPAGISVTVPEDATAAYLFWAYYSGSGGGDDGLAAATLNGQTYSQALEFQSTETINTACGVAAWYNPATGSQTLDVAWDATTDEGPVGFLVFTKDGDTTSWRDADAICAEGGDAASVTLTTQAGDLVIMIQKDDASIPSAPGGFASLQTQSGTTGGDAARLSSISASGTTQACTAQSPNYAGIAAISIPAAGGGGAALSIAPIMQNYRNMGLMQ